eukprot:6321355-Alexandrium_andersonii.AAC.1
MVPDVVCAIEAGRQRRADRPSPRPTARAIERSPLRRGRRRQELLRRPTVRAPVAAPGGHGDAQRRRLIVQELLAALRVIEGQRVVARQGRLGRRRLW